MHWIKNLIIVCFVGAVFAALGGCHSTPTPQITPTSEEEEFIDLFADRIRIRWFIGLGTGRSETALAVAQNFVDQYNQSQERIGLVLEVAGYNTGSSTQNILERIQTGVGPDIATPAGSWTIYQFADYLLPLDPGLILYELSDISPKELGHWQENGEMIGFPLGVSPSILYYNRDLFDRAGLPYPPHEFGEPYADGEAWSIEKMERIAMQLTLDAYGTNALEPGFDSGNIVQWGYWFRESTRSMAALFGPGSVIDGYGNASLPGSWMTAFRWYYEGMWQNYFIPTDAHLQVFQGDPFRNGRAAMINTDLSYSARLMDNSNWDMAATPSYQRTITTRLEANAIVILKSARNPLEAIEVAYLIANSPELLSIWGIVPAFKSLQPTFVEQLILQKPDVDWQVLLDGLEYGDLSHESNLPNYAQAYERLEDFQDTLQENGELDLVNEMDELIFDLQDIFEAVR